MAHLDRDRNEVLPELTLHEIDDAIGFIGSLWERWYPRVTGAGVMAEAPLTGEWWTVLRLEHLESRWERVPREAQT